MPNTLGHLGIQTLATRGVLRDADVKWIWAACVVPDLPWIGQRVVRGLGPGLSPIDIRLYAIVQTSLLFCLVLSACLACFSRSPGRTFGILAAGALMHLLLDALQTKWGNGVVLFAPFCWDLTNFGLFWPENAPTLALTVLGLIVAIYAFWRLPKVGDDLRRPRGAGLAAAVALLALYLAGPIPLMPEAEEANLHHVRTLREVTARAGQPIGFDRSRLDMGPEGARLAAWTGEVFTLEGEVPADSGTVSIRGRFRDADTIEVLAFHAHRESVRDHASYLGLGLVALWWAACLLARWREVTPTGGRAGSSRSRSRASGGSRRR